MNRLSAGFGLLVAIAVLALASFLHNEPQRAHAQDLGSGVRPMGSLWSSTAPSISAGIFSTPLKPTTKASIMRLGIQLRVSSIVYITESNGTTTTVGAINGGSAITAFQPWTGEWPMRNKDESGNVLSYNFVLGTNGGIDVFRADEELGGGH